jgi:hypothetical protein
VRLRVKKPAASWRGFRGDQKKSERARNSDEPVSEITGDDIDKLFAD